jgi:hypothetical protein
MLPSVFDYTTAYFTQLNEFSEKNIRRRKTICNTEVNPICCRVNILYSFPLWRQVG